ncbi:hypothetical protein IQ06DRAFT_36684 [Phaeosphaeriaceae sp. SRC1lsM3a]|nr:hypothetical protein IQ06DRAFT_36684 [Stagonospora sp. SRC1lsM3a]
MTSLESRWELFTASGTQTKRAYLLQYREEATKLSYYIVEGALHGPRSRSQTINTELHYPSLQNPSQVMTTTSIHENPRALSYFTERYHASHDGRPISLSPHGNFVHTHVLDKIQLAPGNGQRPRHGNFTQGSQRKLYSR